MNQSKPVQLSFSSAFQLKYGLVVLMVFVCVNGLLYLLLDRALGGTYLESLRTLYFLDQNLPFYLGVIGLIQILVILVLTLIITLLVSHQIAGPIFRYEEVLGQVAAGQFPERVATRKTDQLKPMVDSLNDLSTSLRGVYRNAQILSEELSSSGKPDTELVTRQICRIRENMGEFLPDGGDK
ncbi:MAG: methyl-accepting chemotaxis protein [Desulfuromonadales bacterium]|nr:methyl-accepting chemotaxis protein [Desulfuromonadales bacterium]MBN2791507.1 methyl-accepting chemotaxis protein [Desulfuromonadales bacterium]